MMIKTNKVTEAIKTLFGVEGGRILTKINIVSEDTIYIEVIDNDIQCGGAYWDDKLKGYLSFKKINVVFERNGVKSYLIKVI